MKGGMLDCDQCVKKLSGNEWPCLMTCYWNLSFCTLVQTEPVTQITEEVRDQLVEASAATRKAYNTYRREVDPDDHYSAGEGAQSAADKNKDELEMSPVITIMQPILRFLQLLCENHNRDLQVCQAKVAHLALKILFHLSRKMNILKWQHVFLFPIVDDLLAQFLKIISYVTKANS